MSLWHERAGSEPNGPHAGEQAIAKYVEAEALEVLAEGFAVRTAVVINDENTLMLVAAQNNELRRTRSDDPGHARHADNLSLAGRKVSQYVTVPFATASCAETTKHRHFRTGPGPSQPTRLDFRPQNR